jgi:hypothetical protein
MRNEKQRVVKLARNRLRLIYTEVAAFLCDELGVGSLLNDAPIGKHADHIRVLDSGEALTGPLVSWYTQSFYLFWFGKPAHGVKRAQSERELGSSGVPYVCNDDGCSSLSSTF